MIKGCLLVMLGGGIGSVLRYLVTKFLKKSFDFKHWATFWVNVTGCFALGFLFEVILRASLFVHVFVIVGIIGSYTTFSTFEYENIDLIAHERYIEFLKYSVLSCLFAFLAVGFGFWLASFIYS